MSKLDPAPRWLQKIIQNIIADDTQNGAVKLMMSRKNDFENRLQAILCGIAVNPESRRTLDDAILNHWRSESSMRPFFAQEAIVGAGPAAAVYSAVRVASGHPRPIVLERSDTPGGSFAVSRNASFHLNSRNRPGGSGRPGDPDNALNFLPGAPLQPAHLSVREYQTNTDLAFLVRLTLAMYANVHLNAPILAAVEKDGRFQVNDALGRTRANVLRVLDARGLGAQTNYNSPYLLNYSQFWQKMDQPFPLQGIRSIAVIGQGDSGKTVIETLLGQGPCAHKSVPALDWPQKIDWYTSASTTCETVSLRGARTRYKALAPFLRSTDYPGRPVRVNTITARAVFAPTFNGAIVNGANYDLVIDCTGFRRFNSLTKEMLSRDAEVAANAERTILMIGVTADLPPDANESSLLARPENYSALWRYMPRIARVATTLPALKAPPAAKKEIVFVASREPYNGSEALQRVKEKLQKSYQT